MPRSYKISDTHHGCQNDSIASNFLRTTYIDGYQKVKPEVARQHAVAAANTAFNSTVDDLVQDQARASADMPRRLRKTQSVRFTGPRANQKPPRSITRRVAPTWDHISSGIRLSPQKSPVRSNLLHGVEDKAIAKSSYRRIKKSRSMFSPRKTFMTPTPIYEPHLQKKRSLLSGSTAYAYSSPDRGVTRAEEALMRLPNSYQTTYNQDKAIKMAQQEYRRQIEGLQGPHSLSRSQSDGPSADATKTARKKSSRLFKPTVRTTSGNQYGASVSSEPVSDSRSRDGMGVKARKVSWSLRKKLLRILGMKPPKQLPIQQVQSERPHWSNFGSDVSEDALQGRPLIPLPDDHLLSRVRSRASNVTPIQGNKSRTSSLHELFNEEPDQDGSRATSWATSTITNDTALSIPPYQRKRLTVIDENCDAYQPSTSTNVGQMPSRSRYDAFRRPLKPGRINEPVDSQQMYNVLQQRFERSGIEPDEQPTGNSPSSSRRSSLQQRITSQVSNPKTDNSATTFMDRGSGSSEAVSGFSNALAPGSVNPGPSDAVDDVFAPERKGSGAFSVLKAKKSIRRLSFTERKSSRKKNTLRESHSSFFPSQNLKKPSGTSPYKLAMRSSSKYKTKIDNILHRHRKRNQSPNENLDDVDSIYSRDVTGTPFGMERHLTSSESIAEFGTATVRDSQVMAKHYSELISEYSHEDRVVSGASTLDWKAWATKQVASLSDLSEENLGALRENANANPWTSDRVFADDGRNVGSIPTPGPVRPNQNDGSYDFDYGFATSSVLREQQRRVSGASRMEEDNRSSSDESSEVSDRDHLPLTERNISQSNVLRVHSREQRMEAPSSTRHQSGENQRYHSPRTFRLAPSDSTSAYTSMLRNVNTQQVSPDAHNINKTNLADESDLGSHDLNTQTVIIRRNRRERAERLRRIKSSKALLSRNGCGSSINNKSKHDFQGLSGFRGEIVPRSPDHQYETSRAGMLRLRLRYGESNRLVEPSTSGEEDESEHQDSPAFV